MAIPDYVLRKEASRNEQFAQRVFRDDYSVANVEETLKHSVYSPRTIVLLRTIAKKNNRLVPVPQQSGQLAARLPHDFIPWASGFVLGLSREVSLTPIQRNTLLAVLVILATNLRSSEIGRMTVENFSQLTSKQLFTVKTKKKNKSLIIVANEPLLRLARQVLSSQTNPPTTRRLLSYSISRINRYIRSKYPAAADKSVRVGLAAFRKMNTTLLYRTMTADSVAAFNRHSFTGTGRFYNANTYEAELDAAFGR